MNLYKEIIKNEVYPAIGCTEPLSCAYGAAIASEKLDAELTGITIELDPATFKNGARVIIPNTQGTKGNQIATALGALIKRSDLKLELFKQATPDLLVKAKEMVAQGKVSLSCRKDKSDLYIDVTVKGEGKSARAIIQSNHTNVVFIAKNDNPIFNKLESNEKIVPKYRQLLKKERITNLLDLIDGLDQEDLSFIKNGIEVNLNLSEVGMKMGRAGYQLQRIHEIGYLKEDVFYKTKVKIAAAIDARMGGANHAAMTSGGSGNQGIITTLTPYITGIETGISERKILESIGLAHVINSYTKSHLGELSVICGCAMSAGIAAACGIVYQRAGCDLVKINLAVNNVIGDLSGLICDGAKQGCALKGITSVDSALRSSFMALEGFCGCNDDGVVGNTAEESIANLAKLTLEGMFGVDPTVLKIIQKKSVTQS